MHDLPGYRPTLLRVGGDPLVFNWPVLLRQHPIDAQLYFVRKEGRTLLQRPTLGGGPGLYRTGICEAGSASRPRRNPGRVIAVKVFVDVGYLRKVATDRECPYDR